MELKDLAVDHDYYCSDNNYYSLDAGLEYDTFKEFYEDFKDADVDMNLVFRWDVMYEEEKESYFLQIFMMQQRKGIFKPVFIENIYEDDVENLISYLNPHIEKLKSIWKPLKF